MTQEEKAKAYDEALERARKLYNDAKANEYKSDMEDYESIFPELAESEDERIRKRLIEYFEGFSMGNAEVKWEGLNVQEVLVWLEKQKECVSNNFDDVWDEEDCEEIIAEGQKLTPRFKELLKEVCHAWYDRGAKLEKQKEVKWSPSECEMGVLYKLCYVSNQITDEDDTELTRLYQDLKREYFNGHSFENMFPKEKQKEQKPVVTHGETYHVDTLGTQQVIAGKMPQKPAEWSDEDEEILKLLILNIGRYMYFGGMSSERILSFLKSLRSQPKQEWSEEDEKMLQSIIKDFRAGKVSTIGQERWLKSLLPQQRQEWSDEEKEILDSILSHYVLIDKPIDANGISKEKYISLIKSIRFDTYKNCNSHWKPSEEQMKAMSYFVRKHQATANRATTKWPEFEAFKSLYNDLKKLM